MKIHPTLQNFDPYEIGFRCGLEVHQQLLTDHKLFCACPAGPYSEEYDTQVLRHMRPTLSELGEYDGTALMEFKTHKEIIYRLHKPSVCTYEMDDTPPFAINRQAVDIAIEIALLFNCSIVDELHVIRKQYLDGSIPAGFQRTAIVGVNGWIPVGDRKVGIRQLAIEEDACREVSDQGHRRIYMTDRLSIPLVEVVTEPDIHHPREGLQVGWEIARLLRATGKIRRGIGRVRQDVNVSIEGGTRVEIKGVPRIPIIPRLVLYEAYRQHRLLVLRELMFIRGFEKDALETERFDLTDVYEDFIPQVSVDETDKVGAIVLKGMRGLLNHPIGPYRTFADDVAGRVRVIACLEHLPVMVHTDDHSSSGLSDRSREALAVNTNMGDDDCAVVVWGSEVDVKTALSEIEARCREAMVGIPNETRQVKSNGETDFERILPGPDRMYPDTDTPPLTIHSDQVEQIRSQLPERPWEREERYHSLRLPDHWVSHLVGSPRAGLFDRLVADNGISPKSAAIVLVDLLTHYRRMGGSEEQLSDNDLDALFDHFRDGDFAKEGFRMLLEESARQGSTDWMKLMKELHIEPVDDDEVERIVVEAVDFFEENARSTFADAQFRLVVGNAMERLRGRIDGATVAKMILQWVLPDAEYKADEEGGSDYPSLLCLED